MTELLNNPLGYAFAAIVLARGGVRLLRETLQLRNEWYRRER
jgi:hypothetical protein